MIWEIACGGSQIWVSTGTTNTEWQLGKVTLSRFMVVTFFNTPMIFTRFIIVLYPLLRLSLQWLLFEEHMAVLPGWSIVMRRSGTQGRKSRRDRHCLEFLQLVEWQLTWLASFASARSCVIVSAKWDSPLFQRAVKFSLISNWLSRWVSQRAGKSWILFAHPVAALGPESTAGRQWRE